MDKKEDDINGMIFKLIKAIRGRLVEVQYEEKSSPESILIMEHHSNLHAISVKIFESNQVNHSYIRLKMYLNRMPTRFSSCQTLLKTL